jgi:hypothetical protein
MKKVTNVFKVFLSLVLLMVVGIVAFGQTTVPTIPDWTDLYENYGVYFATAGGIAGIAMFLGELVIRVLKLAVKWQKVAIIWVLSVVASFVGAFVLNVGYLAEATWWETVIWGVFSGLLANGIWSSNVAFIKSILEFLVELIKAKIPATV